MDAPIVVLLALLLFGLPIGLAIWLIARAIRAADRIEQLSIRQSLVERDLARLSKQLQAITAAGAERPAAAESPDTQETLAAPQPTPTAQRVRPVVAASMTPAAPAPSPAPHVIVGPKAGVSVQPQARPPMIPSPPRLSPSVSAPPSSPDRLAAGGINWEQFVGVKLLMWLGGFTAFLTVVFAVKYSFDRNWITPALRVAAGFLTGFGLLVAGGVLHQRKRYRVGAQTFCATGILILYATAFACRSIYHFEFFDLPRTFLLMALITAAAFVVAVRLEARVVAVLGICGGFLTPVLLSTGEDNPFGLFTYILLLDVGLLAVALRMHWHFLAPLGALGTVLMQIGWLNEFFVEGIYSQGNKVLIALAVFVTFSVLFAAAWSCEQRRQQGTHWLTSSAIAVPAVAMALGFYLLDFETLGRRPGLLFGYLMLIDLCLLSLVWQEVRLASLQLVAGGAAFLLLTTWMLRHLSAEFLLWGLVLTSAFAVLHSALPYVLGRLRPGGTPLWWGHLFPPLALLLLLAPILRLETVSFLLWPFALLLNGLIVLLALLSASVLWILLALALTVILAACWIGRAPADLTALPLELVVIGGFAVFFFSAGLFAARKLGARSGQRTNGSPTTAKTFLEAEFGLSPDAVASQVPAFSAALPFLLLLQVTLRLPLHNPSPVFGLALGLILLLLLLARWFPMGWLTAVGLGCVLALEHAWQLRHFQTDAALVPLLWHLAFTVVFMGFPFFFWRSLAARVVPWATAALAGPLHFYLVHRLVRSAWPNDVMGLLPAAFAVAYAPCLWFLVRSLAADAPNRNTLLAWFGAAVLFFVTLVFPVQFERQWITLGWALEGVALLWLFHHVPHPGLRLVGVGLLVVAFARLALNPAVLHYHPRAEVPLLNWYLYAYGLTTACLYAAAALLAPPRHQVWGANARVLLTTLGTVLAFLLLNLEIADYFTAAGATVLTFEFSGNLARDMTYSIGWGLFALGLVVAGILRQLRAPRYAGIALLGVTLLKLFLHDLARLQALYRIGALLGVAVAAIAASFLYQRFFADESRQLRITPEKNPATPSPQEHDPSA